MQPNKITRRRAMAVSLGTIGAAAVATTATAAPPARTENGAKTWTLADSQSRLFAPPGRLGPEDLGAKAAACSVTWQTLQGGLSTGVDVVEVDNGRMSFTLLPTRGMGIWQARCGEERLGWDSPVQGPVHPAFVRLDEPSGLGWLAGFDEMLVRCGLEYNGGPEFAENGTLRYGLHGRIANTPAHDVSVSVDSADGTISVTGVVDESRLFGNKLRLTSTTSTRPQKTEITIRDTIENLSREPGELELIYHTNFGPPLAGPGAVLVAPANKVTPFDEVAKANLPTWNVLDKEDAGSPEKCFACALAAGADGRTAVLLSSADRTRAVYYRFNKTQLPCFTLWKNNQCAEDGYAVGLEPGTNIPNTKTEEKQAGRVILLKPGESRTFELTLEYLADPEAVQAAADEIGRLGT